MLPVSPGRGIPQYVGRVPNLFSRVLEDSQASTVDTRKKVLTLYEKFDRMALE
jgi:hypothetical protein